MKALFTLLIVGTVGFLVSEVNAGPKKKISHKSKVNTRWEKKADNNNDGRVGPKEAHKAKSTYLQKKSEVDTKWEEKADKNDDGKVGPKELKKANDSLHGYKYLKKKSKLFSLNTYITILKAKIH